jgi:hypothetical protein
MSLRLVTSCLCYRHYVCSRGYERAREENDPRSLVNGVESSPIACVLVTCDCLREFEWPLSLLGYPASPFIGQVKCAGYTREIEKERERKAERERAQGQHRPSSPVGASH